MKKKLLSFIVLLLATVFIVACGNNEGAKPADADETLVEEEETVEEEEQEESVEEVAIDSHFADLIAFMQEETEGTAAVLYENTDGETHEMEGVTVSLEAYSLVELLDFHSNFGGWFDDETDGAVILSQYTITNETDEDLYYTPNYLMTYKGADKDISTYNSLLSEEHQIPSILSDPDEFWLKAGDEITRYYAYPLGEDRLEEVLSAGAIEVEITVPQTDPDDSSSTIGTETTFTLPIE